MLSTTPLQLSALHHSLPRPFAYLSLSLRSFTLAMEAEYCGRNVYTFTATVYRLRTTPTTTDEEGGC